MGFAGSDLQGLFVLVCMLFSSLLLLKVYISFDLFKFLERLLVFHREPFKLRDQRHLLLQFHLLKRYCTTGGFCPFGAGPDLSLRKNFGLVKLNVFLLG
jgi:hypothetical protein